VSQVVDELCVLDLWQSHLPPEEDDDQLPPQGQGLEEDEINQ